MAIPGAVIGQNGAQNGPQSQDNQAPDQYSKPSPNIQAPMAGPTAGPNNQGPMDQTDQDAPEQDSAIDQGAMNQVPAGPNGPGIPTQIPITPAPVTTRRLLSKITEWGASV